MPKQQKIFAIYRNLLTTLGALPPAIGLVWLQGLPGELGPASTRHIRPSILTLALFCASVPPSAVAAGTNGALLGEPRWLTGSGPVSHATQGVLGKGY